MSVTRVSRGFAAGVLLLALTGCVKQQPTMRPPPAPQNQPSAAAPAEFQPQELERKAGQFAELVRRLPAATPEDDRQLMRQVFNILADTLPLTVGPNRGGVFEHQLSVVNDTRSQ